MAVPAMTIEGDVVAVQSHWTDDRSRIVTEATVVTPDGAQVVVSQLGGTVDGIAMITMPGPPILMPGMKVAVAAHRGLDVEQREHVVLDSVKVFAYPSGYVRTGPTDGGHSLYWESGCVFVTVDDAGTTAIPGDQEFPVIQAAIDTWNNATHTASCSYLEVINEGRKSLEARNDRVNLIKFHDTPCVCEDGVHPTSWGCRPAVGRDPAHCFDAAAAGVTTVAYINTPTSARDGAIVDADIELNGVNFAITVNGETTSAQSCAAELQNTLTHELGHLRGLEHPCLSFNDPPRFDHRRNPVPSCGATSDPVIVNATMYNFQQCGEKTKESLSPDDIQAICESYPVNDDPGSCDRVDPTPGGCCGASASPGASFLLAGTLLLLLRRVCRKPRQRW